MQGVTNLTAFYRNGVTLTSGATSVADWTDGPPAVAYQTHNGHTAVGFNAYLGVVAQPITGNWGRTIVNAGRCYGAPPCGSSPTPSPTPTATGSCTPSWSSGPNMPTVLVRAVGVYFPDGNFYTMGGRTADTAGSDFQHVLKYSPGTNSWTQMGVTLPDNQMNNMACGVLTLSGTPYIYCVGGSAAGQTTAAPRVFFYNPVTDMVNTLTSGDNWPGECGRHNSAGWLCSKWQQTVHTGRVQHQRSLHQ